MKDYQLLVRIKEQNLAGIEPKCHKSCHTKYTSCVNPWLERKLRCKKSRGEEVEYNIAFEKFCTKVIDKRVIDNGEVLSTKTLEELFIAFVDRYEISDESTCSNFGLKPQLMRKYSENIVFFRPNVDRS